MRVLDMKEVDQVGGGYNYLNPDQAATLILALGAMGGVTTFGFAFPIALALFIVAP